MGWKFNWDLAWDHSEGVPPESREESAEELAGYAQNIS